jgi:hypothetical protein
MTRTNSRSPKRPARVKRPELPRTEPLRSWAGIFGADATAGAAPDGRPAAGRNSGQAVQRGVELGYRVIDEYMKQGAAVANAFGGPRRKNGPSDADLPKMTQRMMQYASDFTALWFDAMGLMMNNAEQQPGARAGQPGPAAGKASTATDAAPRAAAGTDRSRLVLELRSAKAAEVIVALDEPLHGPVRVEPLRARSGSQKITDVAVEPRTEAAQPLKVRVHVPDRLRPGRYTGAIVDAASGQPRGRLTVLIAK